MTDTAVNDSPQTIPHLPDAPILPDRSPGASAPVLETAPPPAPLLPTSTTDTPTLGSHVLDAQATTPAEPSLPIVSPVLSAPSATPGPIAPGVAPDAGDVAVAPVADMPVLPDAPTVAPATVEDPTDGALPTSKASEASKWAAEVRAAQKAKAKKIKIGLVAGSLAVAALAGPPLVSWLTNAINEVGTTTEQPAE